MDRLSKKIRYARRNADLSQKRLGQKLGVSEMAISAYETGRAVPPWPALKKISELTGFSLEYFTEDKEQSVTMEELGREIQQLKKDIKKILEILNGHEK